MTITGVKRERFTAFESLDFAPSPGVNVLVGANGTGKIQLMKTAYAVSRTETGFVEKLARVFMPSGGVGRLVKRTAAGSLSAVEIHRGDLQLRVPFEEVYADILHHVYLPALRGPAPTQHRNSLAVLRGAR